MPQAILIQDVETLGERGTVVDVSKGYLRNFLIPRKLAEPATRASIEAAKRRETAAERALATATARAEEEAELLNRTVLTIAHQAGDDGRLFGSVTSQDIADAIRQARGILIHRREGHRGRDQGGPRPHERPPQGPPRRADQDRRHAHGQRRDRRRRRRQRQDHGGRAEVAGGRRSPERRRQHAPAPPRGRRQAAPPRRRTAPDSAAGARSTVP